MAFNFSGKQKRQKITLCGTLLQLNPEQIASCIYKSSTHNKNITDSLGRDVGVNLNVRVVLLFPKTSRNLENKSSEAVGWRAALSYIHESLSRTVSF